MFTKKKLKRAFLISLSFGYAFNFSFLIGGNEVKFLNCEGFKKYIKKSLFDTKTSLLSFQGKSFFGCSVSQMTDFWLYTRYYSTTLPKSWKGRDRNLAQQSSHLNGSRGRSSRVLTASQTSLQGGQPQKDTLTLTDMDGVEGETLGIFKRRP